MTINVNFFNYCQSQLSSTGVEPQEGEVLAPMFVQGYSNPSETSGLIRSTFRQFRIMGISILTAFVPVMEEEYEQTVWWFNNSVNDYLKPYRKLGNDAIEVSSWEALTEKRDYQTDDEGVEWFLLMEQFEFLKNKLSDSRYQTPLILEMLFEGYDNKEIFEKLGVKKSAGYKKVTNAQNEGLKLYKELN
ncbi:hypothetical protein MKN50_06105 [Streptococcus suis]|uniref:hypothetical protein n=1 Tax=Streptococcus suis TaxID=1307 RepID=UPI001EE87F07|nr:hypothetical protein [Streptococcus suis]MBS7902845.1 hypothetical protein [Streptococcus suis]MDG3248484.1 hypothetical protein [Streptococcus suis]MDG3250017.1 hypothetical protein [Streptococcus suis]MDG3287195.1 hypothetical protein [Streptococcus suis]MDG3331868.1 hypothetical protein [Streptococcus suis]